MGLGIPRKVTMTGGLYLWKDGREVPDTMNVSMEHAEELLYSWDSSFGNERLGVTEDVLGDNGAITHTMQSIRYQPEKKNRPDGTEMAGMSRSDPKAHMQNFVDHIRGSAREVNCPFEVAIASPSPAVWPWTATAAGARCAGTRRRKRSFDGRPGAAKE